jgi:hypothetical protein
MSTRCTRLLVDADYENPGVEIVRSFGADDLGLLASSALAELRLDELPADQLAATRGPAGQRVLWSAGYLQKRGQQRQFGCGSPALGIQSVSRW